MMRREYTLFVSGNDINRRQPKWLKRRASIPQRERLAPGGRVGTVMVRWLVVVDNGAWVSQPNATSSTIIIAKPAIAQVVARSVCEPDWDSGISSSMTTKTIAPAAKLRA